MFVVSASAEKDVEAGPEPSDYDFSQMVTAAERGDAEAQFRLAIELFDGVDPGKNAEQVLYWLRQSSKGGFVAANHSLGFLYQYGEGVDPDLDIAISWYRIAANMGFGPSQTKLGDFYLYGEGDQPSSNYGKALYWYSLGAEQNDPSALFGLGIMHAEGFGVEKDAGAASAYFERAAEVGDLGAQIVLGNQYFDEQKYDAAAKYLQLAADQGDADSQYNLAILYEVGAGVDRDFVKMTELFGLAAAQQMPEAQHAYALSYLNGLGVDQNYLTAFKWQKLAAEQGLLDAQFALANMYLQGHGTTRDLTNASKWFLVAAEQGDVRSQVNLTRLLYESVDEQQDRAYALMWASIAAKTGLTAAVELQAEIDRSMKFYDVRRTKALIEQCLARDLKGCSPLDKPSTGTVLEQSSPDTEYLDYINQHLGGAPLSAECFQFHWSSSDNVENYREALGIKNSRFGQYVGEFVSSATISDLSRTLETCGASTEAAFKTSKYSFSGRKYVESKVMFGEWAAKVNYRVVRTYPADFCSAQLAASTDIKHCWLVDMQPYRKRELSLTAIDKNQRFIPVRWDILEAQFPEFGFQSWADLN